MECVSVAEKHPRNVASGLTFSIDKIIGLKTDVKHSEKTENFVNETEKSSNDLESPVGERPKSKEIEKTVEKVAEKSGPISLEVKHLDHQKVELYSENKGKHLQVTSNENGAVLYDTDLQRRNFLAFQGREFQDINMNIMSYLHPAFLLGRMNPEEYRAHFLHNYYLQHQNPHIGKDASYALDLYKMANAQYFNSQTPQDFKKQRLSDSLHTSEQLHHTEGDLKQKPKFETKETNFGIPKIGEGTTKEVSSETTKEFLETRDKKFQNKTQKTFTCQECGKMFNAHYNLTRHMPVHTG